VSVRTVIALSIALSIVLAATGTGCGSSSDTSASSTLVSKDASEILEASKTAAEQASSVRVLSESGTGPLRLTLDLQLARDSGYARVKILGTSFEVIRLAETLYLRGTPRLYQRLGITDRIPAGSWVATPAGTPRATELASSTSLAKETGLLLTSTGPITKGAATTLDGQPAIELKPSGELYTGNLYIANTGQPYPLKLERHGSVSGITTFEDWNDSVAITPPANAIHVSGLGH
jgi:hypothetical protein